MYVFLGCKSGERVMKLSVDTGLRLVSSPFQRREGRTEAVRLNTHMVVMDIFARENAW